MQREKMKTGKIIFPGFFQSADCSPWGHRWLVGHELMVYLWWCQSDCCAACAGHTCPEKSFFCSHDVCLPLMMITASTACVCLCECAAGTPAAAAPCANECVAQCVPPVCLISSPAAIPLTLLLQAMLVQPRGPWVTAGLLKSFPFNHLTPATTLLHRCACVWVDYDREIGCILNWGAQNKYCKI